METVSGVTYAKLVSNNVNNEWNINPFDINGNLIPEITLECDVNIVDMSISVPYTAMDTLTPTGFYSTNGQSNFKIKIVYIGEPNGNIVEIYAFGNPKMTFSGYPSDVITLSNLHDSVEIIPIGTDNVYQVLLNVAPLL